MSKRWAISRIALKWNEKYSVKRIFPSTRNYVEEKSKQTLETQSLLKSRQLLRITSGVECVHNDAMQLKTEQDNSNIPK